LRQKSEIPPTAVGGLFKSFLIESNGEGMNPANGSWRIVQVRTIHKYLSTAGSELLAEFWINRSDLNHPPTAVGGINNQFRLGL